MSKKFEIAVMAENPGGQMVMMDRCVLRAEDTADAARQYAGLFSANAPAPGGLPVCASCEDPITVATGADGERLCFECARDTQYCGTEITPPQISWDEDAPQEGR